MLFGLLAPLPKVEVKLPEVEAPKVAPSIKTRALEEAVRIYADPSRRNTHHFCDPDTDTYCAYGALEEGLRIGGYKSRQTLLEAQTIFQRDMDLGPANVIRLNFSRFGQWRLLRKMKRALKKSRKADAAATRS